MKFSHPILIFLASLIIFSITGCGGGGGDSGGGGGSAPVQQAPASGGTSSGSGSNNNVTSTPVIGTPTPLVNPNADDDGDGVLNGSDRCAGFDDNKDIDGDGVPDGCDACSAISSIPNLKYKLKIYGPYQSDVIACQGATDHRIQFKLVIRRNGQDIKIAYYNGMCADLGRTLRTDLNTYVENDPYVIDDIGQHIIGQNLPFYGNYSLEVTYKFLANTTRYWNGIWSLLGGFEKDNPNGVDSLALFDSRKPQKTLTWTSQGFLYDATIPRCLNAGADNFGNPVP